MREALLILAVIAVLLGLTAFRYRRQILAGVQVWRMLKQMRQNAGTIGKQGPEQAKKDLGPLVNCSKCGTWVPESKAISLNSQTYFCSKECVEMNVR